MWTSWTNKCLSIYTNTQFVNCLRVILQCDVMEASAVKQATAEVPRSLSAGVTEDFEAFSEKFIAAQSVRYEHFLEIWKEMQMSLIFAGRQSDQECREVCFTMHSVMIFFITSFINKNMTSIPIKTSQNEECGLRELNQQTFTFKCVQ